MKRLRHVFAGGRLTKGGEMSTYTQTEKKRLWEMAQNGNSAEEMMNALSLDIGSVKEALSEIFREKGQTIAVPGLIGEPGLRTRYSDKGIRIDPAMLEGSAFRAGDEFDLEIEENRITLNKK